MEQPELSHAESLNLISQMINRAKDSYRDTGIGAMMWGIVIAICSLVRFCEIHFGFKLPFDIFLLTIVALIPQIWLNIKENKERKVKFYDDRYLKYLWMAFGISIFLLVHVINLAFQAWGPAAAAFKAETGQSSSFRLGEYVMPLFLILYGLPTFVTGAACKFRPMLIGGIICWLCSIAAVYTNYKVDLLLTAFAALLAWFVPGILMEREYRRYKMEHPQNV